MSKKKKFVYITPWEKKCRAKRKLAAEHRKDIVDEKKKEIETAKRVAEEQAAKDAEAIANTVTEEKFIGPENK